MTASEELTLLESAYTTYLTTGVASYSVDGRSVTRVSIEWLTKRIDQLRSQVARETTGSFYAAQLRNPE